MKYLDLKLGYKCNNDCLHCVISDQRRRAYELRGDTNRSFEECRKEILDSKEKGCVSITITGGEPTIRKDFLDIAKFAKDEGFRVLLQSNGRNFSYDKFAKNASLVVDFFMIAIHSHRKEIHDKITQRQGSFEQTISGVKNLVSLSCDVGVKVVLSKMNYKDLLEIVKFVESLGVRYMNVAFPHINGNAMKFFDEIVPRYDDIREYVLEVIDWANKNNFKIDFEEVLPCSLHAEVPLKYFSDLKILRNIGEVKQLDSDVMNWNEVRISSKLKGIVCEKCVFNRFCEGYWREYVDKFGFEEFIPITKLPFEIKEMLVKNLVGWR